MNTALQIWAQRWGVNVLALTELLQILAMPPECQPTDGRDVSEAAIQTEIRLAAPLGGGVLWRNNVGSLTDERGVPVRYGLSNDSAKLNKRVKSSDLIGPMPMVIGPQHVGRLVAVFTAIEVKRAAWVWKSTKRERAQQRYHNIVRACGGVAGFARSVEDFWNLVRGNDGTE